jgi:hypothetical protein
MFTGSPCTISQTASNLRNNPVIIAVAFDSGVDDDLLVNQPSTPRKGPSMRTLSRCTAVLALAIVLFSSVTFAAAAKKYQVTGKITELTDKMIVLQTTKGDERWEIERSADTKVEGDLKVGAKVTIEYRMIAKDVEVKSEK